MERVVSHLTTAIGRAMAEGDPTESVALGRLAVDLDGPEAESRPRRSSACSTSPTSTPAPRPPAAASPAPPSS